MPKDNGTHETVQIEWYKQKAQIVAFVSIVWLDLASALVQYIVLNGWLDDTWDPWEFLWRIFEFES